MSDSYDELVSHGIDPESPEGVRHLVMMHNLGRCGPGCRWCEQEE